MVEFFSAEIVFKVCKRKEEGEEKQEAKYYHIVSFGLLVNNRNVFLRFCLRL